MYASQRNSLSPTWHMLLMGLMSVILFFGGLLTSNDRPVPIVDNLPNEGLLRPTSLLPWESVELSETRLLFRHEEMQEVKSPQRLNQPTQHNLLARHHGFQPFASALPTPAFAERILPAYEKAFLPYAGWDGPVSFALPPPLPATRRLPDRPIFPPSRADGRAPLKGSFSPPAPQKRQQAPAKRRRRGGSTPPVCPTPRLCAL